MKKTFFYAVWLFIMTTAFTAPSRTITGTISDDAGNPVIAYVQVKNTSNRVMCGQKGDFSIRISHNTDVLIVSALGFETKEIAVGRSPSMMIRLSSVTNTLDEVVVMGYGTSRKKDVTGSVAAVAPGMMAKQLSGITSQGETSGLVDRKTFFGDRSYDREGYESITENKFLSVTSNPLSTFSIDVDAASYSNVRRILKSGHLPTPGAVRIEEMVNYFKYDYDQPNGKDPFAVHTEVTACPWNSHHQLLLIGLQGKKINVDKLPPSNLVFLVDVSGSMMMPDRLPLVKASLRLLTDQLREQDRVSIVAYAGKAGLVLPSTSGYNKTAIKEAIDRLEAGGSTAGGAGIQLAYKVAQDNFNKTGNNRVILCTDGDFNVGASSDDALENMIEKEREHGVYLTVLGYGTGNYQDAKMQKLADKGNGNHAYIDDINEAKKVLINEFGGTLFTIAKDVKLQLEFNPTKVKGYRLIGYENRMLAKEDFNDDKKDAGELGSGHTVTALYELIPPGEPMFPKDSVDALRYQLSVKTKHNDGKLTAELLTIKLRYKQPDGDKSDLIVHTVPDKTIQLERSSNNLRFAAAVASFGMLLRNSEFKGESSFSAVRTIAANAVGEDREGYRKEFLQLVDAAHRLSAASYQPSARIKDDDLR